MDSSRGATCRVLLPDLDGELTRAMQLFEELLLTLSGWEEDDAELRLPAPLAGDLALAAFQRLWRDVVAAERAEGRGRLLAPADAGRPGLLGAAGAGHYEHLPLHLAELPDDDVTVLAAVVRALGAPNAPEEMAEALSSAAVAADQPQLDSSAVVTRLAQLVGLLDLAWTEDAELLAPRLAEVAAGRDVVLDPAEEAAYQRTANRLNSMWSLGSPVERFLY